MGVEGDFTAVEGIHGENVGAKHHDEKETTTFKQHTTAFM
jgi:hypothetical protein